MTSFEINYIILVITNIKMSEKRKFGSIENEDSSKKIKLLEDEIINLKQRDNNAQVMSEEINEKMMDRVYKAEELNSKSNELNRKYNLNLFILNRLKKKRKLKKYNFRGKLFQDDNSIGYTTKIKNIENDIISNKLVDFVKVYVACFKYKDEIFMFNDSHFK